MTFNKVQRLEGEGEKTGYISPSIFFPSSLGLALIQGLLTPSWPAAPGGSREGSVLAPRGLPALGAHWLLPPPTDISGPISTRSSQTRLCPAGIPSPVPVPVPALLSAAQPSPNFPESNYNGN